MVVGLIEKRKPSPLGLELAGSGIWSIMPLMPLVRFGATQQGPSVDKVQHSLPEPVFRLLTSVMTTALHDHEGGCADRSVLRYTLIKGILKGGITKLVIKPSATGALRIIRLEDEYDKNGVLIERSEVFKLKQSFAKKNQYSDKGFYGQYITDTNYLGVRLNQINNSERLADIATRTLNQKIGPFALYNRNSINKSNKQLLLEAAEAFHKAQAKQLRGQLDRYALYKANEAWFWTEFLSTDSLRLYFRYYENLDGLIKGKAVQSMQDIDSAENPTTAKELEEKLQKVSAYQNAVYKWSNGETKDEQNFGEADLTKAFVEARKNSLTDYRNTSALINPAVKKLHVANLNAYNYLNRLAKENVRYAEYRVSLTGNDIGDASNETYYYDGQDKLWAVASGLSGAKINNARWGNTIDYGITVLLERQPKLNDAQKKQVAALATEGDKRAYQIQVALKEAHRVVDLALKNKREAIQVNEEKKANNRTDWDPRARITGIDLAGDEANFPADVFASAFEKIHAFNQEMLEKGTPEHRIGITIHAGEEPFSSDAKERNYKWSESIKAAFAVGYKGPLPNNPTGPAVTPFRIGHGIMLWAAPSEGGLLRKEYAKYIQNPRKWANEIKPVEIQAIVQATPLIKQLINGNVGIELCPKSNVQTGSVPYYTVHPALFFYKLGLKVSINTDNRTISNTDNANELIKLHQHLGLRWSELKTMIQNGADTAFIPTSDERGAVRNAINQRFTQLEQDPEKLLGIMLLNGYTPTHYANSTSTGEISQVKGTYKPIDDREYKQKALKAEKERHAALLKTITEQTQLLKKPQPWTVNA